MDYGIDKSGARRPDYHDSDGSYVLAECHGRCMRAIYSYPFLEKKEHHRNAMLLFLLEERMGIDDIFLTRFILDLGSHVGEYVAPD